MCFNIAYQANASNKYDWIDEKFFYYAQSYLTIVGVVKYWQTEVSIPSISCDITYDETF